VRPVVEVTPIRAEYDEMAALGTEASRQAYYGRRFGRQPRRPRPAAASVEELIRSLDARGAWVSDRVMVLPIVEEGMNPGDPVAIRGISTATFVRNLGALTEYVRTTAR
jgi:hypothetical protein